MDHLVLLKSGLRCFIELGNHFHKYRRTGLCVQGYVRVCLRVRTHAGNFSSPYAAPKRPQIGLEPTLTRHQNDLKATCKHHQSDLNATSPRHQSDITAKTKRHKLVLEATSKRHQRDLKRHESDMTPTSKQRPQNDNEETSQ